MNNNALIAGGKNHFTVKAILDHALLERFPCSSAANKLEPIAVFDVHLLRCHVL